MPLLLMLLLAATALGQEPEAPLFRAGVSLVRVDTQVVDRKGKAIQGLKQEDFVVSDQDAPQPITYFESDRSALDVLLLLDVSGSMKRSVEEMAQATKAALSALLPQDRVAVMLFARRAEVRQDFTTDFRAVEGSMREALRETNLGSGTLINPSLLASAAFMGKQEVRGRRAVVILTDNQGLNYQSPDEEVIKAFLAVDTVLNAIVVRGGKAPKDTKIANTDFTDANVFAIAEQTGGESIAANKAGEAFAEMIERIRSRYSLQYAAPAADPGTFRKVRVELSAAARKRFPEARVRARAGYHVR